MRCPKLLKMIKPHNFSLIKVKSIEGQELFKRYSSVLFVPEEFICWRIIRMLVKEQASKKGRGQEVILQFTNFFPSWSSMQEILRYHAALLSTYTYSNADHFSASSNAFLWFLYSRKVNDSIIRRRRIYALMCKYFFLTYIPVHKIVQLGVHELLGTLAHLILKSSWLKKYKHKYGCS